jgi:hypothetical protein
MAEWAALELTPDRLEQIKQEARDKVAGKHVKPWEDDDAGQAMWED